MAGKHSDHYFCRWQAIIVNTINIFFLKKMKKTKSAQNCLIWRENLSEKHLENLIFVFEKNEKCLEFSDLARKLIRKTFRQFYPPTQTCAAKISANVNGGPSGGSSIRRPMSEDPHRRQRNLREKVPNNVSKWVTQNAPSKMTCKQTQKKPSLITYGDLQDLQKMYEESNLRTIQSVCSILFDNFV